MAAPRKFKAEIGDNQILFVVRYWNIISMFSNEILK